MPATYLGVFLVSAATLALETTLTRLFSVAQGYHFAFLAVSLALLGFGASGSALAVWGRQPPRSASPWAAWSATLSLSIVGSYIAANYLPFDAYRLGWDPAQAPLLVVYCLLLTLPFFLSGLILGGLLAACPEQASRLYAANLAGSGLGGLVSVAAIPLVEGRGMIPLAALMAALGSASFGSATNDSTDRPFRPGIRLSKLCGPLACLLCAVLLLARPPVLEPQMSPYKSLSIALRFADTRLLATWWNAFSRVDVVESSSLRSAPGLSLSYPDVVPARAGVSTDGDNLRSLLAWPAEAAFADYLPTALAYRLLDRPSVLVLSPGAGLDVLTARRLGAGSITVVEANPLLVRAVLEYGGDLYGPDVVTVAQESERSYLRRHSQRYDLIHLALADTYHPVAAGAYSLSEDYRYTVEAFGDYYSHLAPGGILMVERWLHTPPSEELRAVTTAVTALASSGVTDAASRVVAVRSLQTMVVLIKAGEWQPGEIAVIRAFCAERGFDPIYFPGIGVQETNIHNVLLEDVYSSALIRLLSPASQRFQSEYAYDITPTFDDRPFHFHVFRWQQLPALLANLGRTWQPFGGAGFLLLLALLAVVAATAAAAILLPLGLAQHRRASRGTPMPRRPTLLLLSYFLCLGLAYVFVEIPLIQRLILLLDQPTYAFVIVVGTLLVSSSAGSLTIRKGDAPGKATVGALSLSLAVLPLLLLAYPVMLRWLLDAFLDQHLAVRALAAIVAMAPLGFLMGKPFPAMLTLVNREQSDQIPWLWGVNGFAGVVGSVLAALLGVSLGLSWVMWAGALAYFAALAAWRGLGGPWIRGEEQHDPRAPLDTDGQCVPVNGTKTTPVISRVTILSPVFSTNHRLW